MQVIDLSCRPSPRHPCRACAGPGALRTLEDDLVRTVEGRLVVVVSDSNVAPLHAASLGERLRRKGIRVELLEFPAGETSKTRETKGRLEDRLFELGAGRDTLVVAVGGGVTGDLAGFVASTWHRGVEVIQVPTSLLSMADAAVGGKTAVNLAGGKNLVGTFHQPSGVYADVSLLSTLPDDEYVSGFAEVVKAAVIADATFFKWLESSVEALLGRSGEALEHAVVRCIQIKSRVVRRDERESGRRAILNFGHTVGHALEHALGYTESHGRAVAIGMSVEARLARAATGLPESHLRRLERLLERFGLPTRIPRAAAVDALVSATYHDKKARDGKAYYALPLRLGRMLPGHDVAVPLDEQRLREVVASRMIDG